MAQKEPETGPSLELPSLFGRRKRRAGKPTSGPGDTATVPRAEEPDTPPEAPPEAQTTAETTAETTGETTGETTAVLPVVEEPPAARTPAVTPTAVPTPTPAATPAPQREPVPQPEPQPEPAPAPQPASQPETAPAPTEPLPPRVVEPIEPPPPVAAAPVEAPKPAPGGRRRAGTSTRSIPELAASTAAFLVGAVVGLAGCVLTYLGLQGCELVTGTNSCGGPGLLVLGVILVAMVLLGAAVLRVLRVPDPANISFLGVGMLTVVALVLLIDYLYDPWMFVVVPAVTAVCFGIARWVTTLYADDVLGDDDDMPHYDIR